MKAPKYKWFKRILLIIAIVAAALTQAVLALYMQIEYSLDKKIEEVKQKYPGKAEDALIAFLLDDKNSPNSKSHIAIWSLGHIQSKKALPILYRFYKNDPEGKTCHKKHHEVICQKALGTAIRCIEKEVFFSHKHLNR